MRRSLTSRSAGFTDATIVLSGRHKGISTTILPGVHLVDNPKYPRIADDLTKTFRTLKSLHCDVFLAPHGSMFGLPEKARRQAAGEKPNPFVDPDGYRSFTVRSEQVFRQQLEHDQRGTATQPNSVP